MPTIERPYHLCYNSIALIYTSLTDRAGAAISAICHFIAYHEAHIVFGSLALMFSLELAAGRYRLPIGLHDGGIHRWLRNLAFGVINFVITISLFLPLTLWSVSAPFGWRIWTPGMGGLVYTIVVLDFTVYWFHRAEHHFPLLWRFHQVHHLDGYLDVSAGLRIHPLEIIWLKLGKAFVIAISGIPLAPYAIYETVNTVHAQFHHGNFQLPGLLDRCLRPFISVPSFHWTHHHATIEDTNSNYAFIFSFWDYLFGTYNRRIRGDDWHIGLEYGDIKSFVGLTLAPFANPPLWATSRREISQPGVRR